MAKVRTAHRRHPAPFSPAPPRVCHHCCRNPPMPRWLCCRACWNQLWTTGPDELPTETEGIALRFMDRYEQLSLGLERAG